MASGVIGTRHIILTGPPGIGKTTLVRKVCDCMKEKGVSTQGFYTEEQRSGGRRTGFDVVTLDGQRGPLARVQDDDTYGRASYKVGQYTVKLQSFEQTALPTIRIPKSGPIPLVVIDEVGKMEMFSDSFIRAVKDLMAKSNVCLLATIPIKKGKPIPLVEAIRGSSNGKLFNISRENRDKVLDEIVTTLLESYKQHAPQT